MERYLASDILGILHGAIKPLTLTKLNRRLSRRGVRVTLPALKGYIWALRDLGYLEVRRTRRGYEIKISSAGKLRLEEIENEVV